MKSTIISISLLIIVAIALFAQHGETSPVPHDRDRGYGGYRRYGGYGGYGGYRGDHDHYSYGHSHGGGYHVHSPGGTFYPRRPSILGRLVGSLFG